MSNRVEQVRAAVEDARSKAVYHRNQTSGAEYALLDEVVTALWRLTTIIETGGTPNE